MTEPRTPITKYGRGLALDCPDYLDYVLGTEDEAAAIERERLRAVGWRREWKRPPAHGTWAQMIDAFHQWLLTDPEATE